MKNCASLINRYVIILNVLDIVSSKRTPGKVNVLLLKALTCQWPADRSVGETGHKVFKLHCISSVLQLQDHFIFSLTYVRFCVSLHGRVLIITTVFNLSPFQIWKNSFPENVLTLVNHF